jgi:hypothetical protein
MTKVRIANIRGPQGEKGEVGEQGPQGDLGPKGDTGSPSNVPGPQGPQGPQGPRGSQGIPGQNGDTGPQGDPGPAGADGVPGPAGADGAAGPAGANGAAGPQGPQGVKGDTGAQGPKGDTGATGAASTVPGPVGPQGPQGVKGDTGATGAASTVPGPTGPQGTTGPAGPGVAAGGAAGTFLRKSSTTDYDAAWVAFLAAHITDAGALGRTVLQSTTSAQLRNAAKATFRGPYSADAVVKSFEFSSGTVPAGLTPSTTGGGTVSVGLTNVFPGTPPNGLANALFLNANNISSTASATVTLSLAALGLSGITRAVIWYSNPGGNNSVFKSYQVLKNGSFLVNRGEGSWPWAAETFNCTSTDTLVLRQVGNQGFASSQTSPAGIALIELYAAADPYMKFDVVVYNGLFYQSNVDNNAATPGGAGWTLLGGVPTGGTAGQVLKKNSTADFDVSWTSLASLLAVGTVDEPPAVANAKSDEFESTTMNAMWSYRGITATSANLTRFPGALFLDIPSGGAAGQGVYQAVPAGDFRIYTHMSRISTSDRQMWGPFIVDSTGTGIQLAIDEPAGDTTTYIRAVNAWVGGATMTAIATGNTINSPWYSGSDIFASIRKSGTTWYASAWTSKKMLATEAVETNFAASFTPAYMGVGKMFGTGSAKVVLDWIRVL